MCSITWLNTWRYFTKIKNKTPFKATSTVSNTRSLRYTLTSGLKFMQCAYLVFIRIFPRLWDGSRYRCNSLVTRHSPFGIRFQITTIHLVCDLKTCSVFVGTIRRRSTIRHCRCRFHEIVSSRTYSKRRGDVCESRFPKSGLSCKFSLSRGVGPEDLRHNVCSLPTARRE